MFLVRWELVEDSLDVFTGVLFFIFSVLGIAVQNSYLKIVAIINSDDLKYVSVIWHLDIITLSIIFILPFILSSVLSLFSLFEYSVEILRICRNIQIVPGQLIAGRALLADSALRQQTDTKKEEEWLTDW